MKKALLVLASMACLGFAAVGCGESEEDACANVTCSDSTQICRAKLSLFGYVGVCAASDELCDTLYGAGKWTFDDSPTIFTCVSTDSSEGGNIDPEDPYCHSDDDCDENYVCNFEESLPKTEDGKSSGYCDPKDDAEVKFKFVRIDDLSADQLKIKTKEDPGADIDAIVLTKAGSSEPIYASSVRGYKRSDGQSSKPEDAAHAYRPEAVIGKPDAFETYPSDTCYYLDKNKDKFTFVSLGGLGGWLIVEMGGVIEAGDKLDVLEVGDCKLRNMKNDKDDSVKAGAEEIQVQISVADQYNGHWNVVSSGKATKGVITATITDAMLQ